MKKRTCGTCGYFQEGDFAGSGWCTHPQRRITFDLKIMVRRGELACRDGWARDLWVPKGEAPLAASPDAATGRPGGPVQPVTSEEMAGLVSKGQMEMTASGKSAAGAPVDVVVGETPAMTDVDDSATLMTNNPRTAIELARRRHLARSGNPIAESGDDQSDEPGSQTGYSSQLPPLSPIRFDHEVPPVQRSEVARAFPGMTSFPDEEDQFSTVPEIVDGIELPRLTAPNLENLVAGDFEEIEEEEVEDDWDSMPHELPRRSLQPEPAQKSTRGFGPAIRRGAPMPPLKPIKSTPEVSDEEVVAQRRRRFGGLRIEALTRSGGDTGRPSWRGRSEPVAYEPDLEPLPEPEWEWDDAQDERTDLYETTDIEVAAEAAVWDDEVWDEDSIDDRRYDDDNDADGEPFDDVLLPTVDHLNDYQVQIAPDVPRMCRTCRDFRPADNGERGWCNNNWAFTHRRMVDADELPCESSLGCWWLPHDDIWLANADVARHSQATPLVDLWLARSDERQVVGAGDGRRR
ncbi:MAG TPA: hypothetical protein VFL82_09245 [Thermomicrobiales bacterium]|nr:hypothetical protein [Thermomicrobiales bacterium]